MTVSTVAPGEDMLVLPSGGGVLVSDGYCGFCTRAVPAVLRFDRRDRVAGHRRPLRGVTPWCEARPEAGCDADVGMSCGVRPPD